MKTLRIAVPALALAALAAAGCMLISGQFVVNYELPSPFDIIGAGTLASESVDLTTVSEYQDHKSELKRVDDLALIGDFFNNGVTATSVEVWILPNTTPNLTSAQVKASGVQLWGPLTIAAQSTEKVNWNRSATLFKGRQTLISEIKGDGKFSLYVLASNGVNIRVTQGALIAVIGAAK